MVRTGVVSYSLLHPMSLPLMHVATSDVPTKYHNIISGE